MRRQHGKSRSSEYVAWSGMHRRCAENRHYTSRGIVVCERWSHFEAFLADMGQRPSARHTVERVNNDRGYEPGNCIWATRKTQRRNQRNTHLSATSAVLMRCMSRRGSRLVDIAHAFGVRKETAHWAVSGKTWSDAIAELARGAA